MTAISIALVLCALIAAVAYLTPRLLTLYVNLKQLRIAYEAQTANGSQGEFEFEPPDPGQYV